MNLTRYRSKLGCALGSMLVLVSISACEGIPHIDRDSVASVLNLAGEETVSTSFDDTRNEVVLPDSFSPPSLKPLLNQPRGPGGGYMLGGGGYEAVLRSFCLHAGTHGPSQGNGYLYAPLKGSKAPIILALLRASARHPEVSQQDVQSLIWAVEARAKFADLRPNLQLAASKLLTARQIYELNGGALGLVPRQAINQALAALPPELRRLYEVQAELRQELSAAAGNYAAIERIAVLAGPAPHNGREVPRGRWSVHPNGFYVRYLPKGYAETRVQVYVPERRAAARNSLAGTAGAGGRPGGLGGASSGAPTPEYDPTNDVAVPANTRSQRLGLSAVPANSDPSKSCQTLTQATDRDRRYDQASGSPCKKSADEARVADAEFTALDVIMRKAYDTWLRAFDARKEAREVLGECEAMHGPRSSKCAKQSEAYDRAMENFNSADAVYERARAAAEKAREKFNSALDKYIGCMKKQNPNYEMPACS